MAHVFLMVCAVVLGYSLWTVAGPATRKTAIRALSRHGIRLAGLAIVVYGLLATSVYFSSSSLF